MRVQGFSMSGANILPGDLLVVDRALEAQDGSIVVALVDGEFTVKRLRKPRPDQVVLQSENPDFPPVALKPGMQFEVWGVVVSTIHFFSKRNPLNSPVSR
jgi:DNA polymerase V